MPNLRFTLEEIKDAIENQSGFCVLCGEEADGVEPDARGYDCESCEESAVYGAEEILLMGLVGTEQAPDPVEAFYLKVVD